MKIVIVRMYADKLNINSYNCQEIGLAKALIRRGHKCDIVLYTNESQREEDILFDNNSKSIHIFYVHAKKVLKNCLFDKKIYDILKNYDVIQSSEYDQIGNVKLRKKFGDKLVIYHGPYESNYIRGYNKKCVLTDVYTFFNDDYKNTKCFAKSELALDFLQKKGFKYVSTVGVGLDVERFEKIKNQHDEIKNISFDNNKYKYLLYIGKLEDRRNIKFIIDILEEINCKFKDVKLIMIGKGEKKYVDSCWKYAKQKGVYDDIIYFENLKQDELPQIYKACDVFLLPTKYEIFGMVLLEAMYFGLPVITTKNGGSSTIIKNNENGFIRENNAKEEWCKVICDIVSNSKRHEEISNNAKKTILNRFTWDCLAEKIEKELLNRNED